MWEGTGCTAARRWLTTWLLSLGIPAQLNRAGAGPPAEARQKPGRERLAPSPTPYGTPWWFHLSSSYFSVPYPVNILVIIQTGSGTREGCVPDTLAGLPAGPHRRGLGVPMGPALLLGHALPIRHGEQHSGALRKAFIASTQVLLCRNLNLLK